MKKRMKASLYDYISDSSTLISFSCSNNLKLDTKYNRGKLDEFKWATAD